MPRFPDAELGGSARSEPVSGIERAVFGTAHRDRIDAWLDEHLGGRRSGEVSTVLFRSGRVAAVYGLELDDGHRVGVKVHRSPATLSYLAAAACQRRLADAGYRARRLWDGPAGTAGLVAVVETLPDLGEPGDAHDPGTRRAMAASLAEQVRCLRGAPVDGLRSGAPARTRYRNGPWPEPHDPMFDFTTTPPQFTWDALAGRASDSLNRSGMPAAVGHGDWGCRNMRFRQGRSAQATTGTI